MERQLKERLIGAAVLVAVAVIMVPEMFSGSGTHHALHDQAASDADSSESGQIKTYRIELQHREGAALSESAVQVPPVTPDNRFAASTGSTPAQTASSSLASAIPAGNSASRSPAIVQAQGSNPLRSTANSTATVPPPIASNSEGWSVQLGSFAAESTAKQVATGARSHGFPVYLASIKVSGKTLYRVRVGPYDDRNDATTALSKLKHSYAQASLTAPNH